MEDPIVFTVEGVMTPAECAALVARIEELGPEAAPITTPRGFVMRPDIRNNTRVIFDDHALASDLFGRLLPELPRRMRGLDAVGANERFRCYRYEPGQRFAPHFDGAYFRPNSGLYAEGSQLSILFYLNSDFSGGETALIDYEVVVQPRRGSMLAFQHAMLHEGRAVRAGTKYVLRTDAMYRFSTASDA